MFYGDDCFKRIRILSRDFIYHRDFDIRGSHTKEKRNKVVYQVNGLKGAYILDKNRNW